MQDELAIDKDNPTEVFFMCDPDKAKGCKKTTCYINGGNCRITTNIEWGKRRVTADYLGGYGDTQGKN